jgi:hypothetical protein
MRSRPWAIAVGIALLVVATSGLVSAEEKPHWEFEFVPYGWVAGNYGSVTVKGRTANFAVTPSDLYQIMEDGHAFGGAGYLSVRYDRWSVFADAFGGYAREGVTEKIPTQLCTLSVSADAKIYFAMSDFAVGYQLGRWSLPHRRRPFTLGVYAGTRYEYFNAKLGVSGGVIGNTPGGRGRSKSWGWADPMIGVRWEVPVLDRFSLDFRGDVGGFGASSQFIWGLVGGVRYWFPWSPWSIQPWLGLGYRVTSFNRDFGSSGSIDLVFRGPTASLGFVF